MALHIESSQALRNSRHIFFALTSPESVLCKSNTWFSIFFQTVCNWFVSTFSLFCSARSSSFSSFTTFFISWFSILPISTFAKLIFFLFFSSSSSGFNFGQIPFLVPWDTITSNFSVVYERFLAFLSTFIRKYTLTILGSM